jgi:hypothetical protein
MENKFFTLWLALIIIAVFILDLIVPIKEALLLNQLSFQQPWRFLTSIFLHGSPTHLIFNLFALILFGLILEKFIGSRNFLLVFFISGILANIISINFYPRSLGASGAIFGIIGCLTILKPLMTVFAFSLPMPLFVASILWVLANIFGIFNPSGVGNIAHLSGLAVGLIFGIMFRQKKPLEDNYKIELPERQIRMWEDKFMR